MPKPLKGTYPDYYEQYIDQVKEDDLMKGLEAQHLHIHDFFDRISEEKSCYAYAPGKWTIKEVLQHIIDAERIFAYRALCFARKETISLPGFDEDSYAIHSHANARSWASLVDELKSVRNATETLLKSFSADMFTQTGNANNRPVTVHAIGFIILGHFLHHCHVISERYL